MNSLISPPKLDIKPLPENLKYVYLGDDETLPMIISRALEPEQEKNWLGCLQNIRKHLDGL